MPTKESSRDCFPDDPNVPSGVCLYAADPAAAVAVAAALPPAGVRGAVNFSKDGAEDVRRLRSGLGRVGLSAGSAEATVGIVGSPRETDGGGCWRLMWRCPRRFMRLHILPRKDGRRTRRSVPSVFVLVLL
jgi:hypothetical protein